MTGGPPNAEDEASRVRPLKPEPLLAVLTSHEVDFLVVGGFAVSAHGFSRATKDIDICPNPTEENLARLAAALEELEAKSIGLDEFAGEFDLRPDLEGLKMEGNWTLITPHGRLDVLQSFSFADAADGEGTYKDLLPHAIERPFFGHRVRFCGYEALLRMKRAANRSQDLVDIESLKAARGEL